MHWSKSHLYKALHGPLLIHIFLNSGIIPQRREAKNYLQAESKLFSPANEFVQRNIPIGFLTPFSVQLSIFPYNSQCKWSPILISSIYSKKKKKGNIKNLQFPGLLLASWHWMSKETDIAKSLSHEERRKKFHYFSKCGLGEKKPPVFRTWNLEGEEGKQML